MHRAGTNPWVYVVGRFRLLNVRADMRFILVTDLVDWLGGFTLLAQSPVISPANPNEPLQGHLARTQDPR